MLSEWLIERLVLATGAALVSIMYLYGFIFLIEAIKRAFARKHSLTMFSFALFFLLSAFSRAFYTIHDLYEISGDFYWKLGLVFNMLALVALVFVCEYALKKTKFGFTVLGVVITTLVPWIYEAILVAAPLLAIVLLVYVYLIKETRGTARKYTIILLIGYVLYGFAVVVGAQLFRTLMGIDRLYLYGIMFLGMLTIAYAMYHFPVMEEIRWADVIENVYLITDYGVPVFYYNKYGEPLDEVIRKSGLIAAAHKLAENIRKVPRTLDYLQFIDTVLVFDKRPLRAKVGEKEEDIYLIVGIEAEERLYAMYAKMHEFLKKCENVLRGQDLQAPDLMEKMRDVFRKIFEETFNIMLPEEKTKAQKTQKKRTKKTRKTKRNHKEKGNHRK